MNGEAKREVVRAVLESLVEGGRLRPDDVVEEARRPESPIHDQFEWDDSKAAEAHRLNQARDLIRTVNLVIIEETRIIETFHYVRDPDAEPNEQGYARVLDLRDDEGRARAALANEAAKAAGYIARVRSLAVGLGLDAEVSEIEAQFTAFRESISI